MKKLYFLLLMMMSLIYVTGCTVAKNKCESDSDCNEGDKCYAAYCSSSVPEGELLFQLDFLNKDDTNEKLGCANSLVESVKLNIKRDDFMLKAEDKHSYNDDVKYKYEQIVSCKEINSEDLTKPYHIGYDKNDHTWGPLQQNKEYIVVATFLDAKGNVPDGMNENGYEYEVRPLVVASKPAKNLRDDSALSIEVKKVQNVEVEIRWFIEDGGELTSGTKDFCFNTNDGVDRVAYFYTKLSLNGMEPCDSEGKCDFSTYDKVGCAEGTDWIQIFNVNQPELYSLEIYAADINDNIKYERTKKIKIKQEQLDAGTRITYTNAQELDAVAK